MHYLLRFCGIAIAIVALAAEAPSAAAQENTFTITCQNVGNGAPEPFADREGHSILVNDYSCRADSGPLSGGVWTGACSTGACPAGACPDTAPCAPSTAATVSAVPAARANRVDRPIR